MRNLGLIITILLASFALPTSSFALGLGQIEIKSFLNQPLNAEIEVISARTGEIENLLVTLASRDSFKRAGLSRPRYLSELRFAVKISEDGDSAVILVTTKSAVKEPFLSFLVEADWSKGRVLREFTVLLDPPFYADIPAPVATVSQPPAPQPSSQSSTSSQPAISRTTTISRTTRSTLVPTPGVDELTMVQPVAPIALVAPPTVDDEQTITEPIALSDVVDDGIENLATDTIADQPVTMLVGDLLVEKGDTLWSFASQFKDSGHSMSQIMLAIQRMNPEAFDANNINHLKVGAVLRAPSAEQLERIGQREAYAEVLVQNCLWNEYVMRVTGATPVAMAGDGGDGGVSGDSNASLSDLSLLAPGDGDSDAAGLQGDGGNADQLSRDLAMAEEELDASQIENSELESRIAELEATLSKVQELQKMVEIEDDSLAQLQADQAAKAAAAEQAAAEQAAAEQAAAETAAAQAAAAEEQAILDQALETAMQAEQASAEAISSEIDAVFEELLAEESMQDGTEVQASAPPPVPAVVTEPIQEFITMLDDLIPEDFLATLTSVLDSLPSMDSILADPIMLGALGGIVLFLLVLVMVKRRKSGDPEYDDDEITVSSEDDLTLKDVDELTPIHVASESSEDESDVSLGGAEDLPDEVADISPIPSTPQAEIAESIAQDSAGEEQDDILNEVDVYLAYGLYDNAEDLLNQSLEANPERADYRSKLLHTYFATKNATKFLEQAETLKSMGTAAESYWDRVQAMGYALAPDNALFSGGKDSEINADDFGVAKPEAADLDIGASEDSTNFSTTDFNLDEDTEEPADDQNFVETLVREDSDLVEATQKLPNLEEVPKLDDEIDTGGVDSAVSEESADELAELEFSLDGEDEASGDSVDDAMDVNLPDDMEGSSTDDSVAESDELTMEFNMEETLVFDANDSADQESQEAENDDSTNIIDMVDGFVDDITAFELDNLDNNDSSQEFGSIDQDMDDTSLDDDLDVGGNIELDASDDEDDFEATALMSVGDEDSDDAGDDLSYDLDDESAMDEDLDSEPVKTGTFAPGDFDDPEELVVSETDIEDVNFDDIDDLMLPDDVDEVGTKLDLARAFIDMGDAEGARSSLDEVLTEGDEDQKAEATGLLKHL